MAAVWAWQSPTGGFLELVQVSRGAVLRERDRDGTVGVLARAPTDEQAVALGIALQDLMRWAREPANRSGRQPGWMRRNQNRREIEEVLRKVIELLGHFPPESTGPLQSELRRVIQMLNDPSIPD